MRENLVRDKSYEFALDVVRLGRKLVRDREFVLSRQVVKAGTSIGANVEEALGAQSRRDFLAKLSIARKEARETHYWLRLIRDSGLRRHPEIDSLVEACDALIRLLTAIIKTTRTQEADS